MIRLDRWLVHLGVGSRSQVQRLIRTGQVQADGQILRDPARPCDPQRVRLSVGGQPLDGRLTRHVMLHKPAGLLTAARDARQPTVMDLLPPVYAALGCMPVGRLDKDTTGLLLLTTDGELSHRLLSPARHVDKRYLATVDGPLGPEDVSAFAQGLRLSDFDALPAQMEILSSSAEEARAMVTLREGKFHQIKRMFAARNREVTALHRQSFGPLSLDDALAPGQWRELGEDEIRGLYAAACLKEEP